MKIRAGAIIFFVVHLLVATVFRRRGPSPIQADARSLVLFSKAAVHWGWHISVLSSGWRNTVFR